MRASPAVRFTFVTTTPYPSNATRQPDAPAGTHVPPTSTPRPKGTTTMSATTLDPATIEGLTDKQREVLSLHQEGKSPTEIGRALDISSQAVHGHFKRLRERGLVPDTGANASASKPAGRRRAAPPAAALTDGRYDVSSVLNAVKLAAAQQRQQLDAREAAIDADIERLNAEKVALSDARKELNKLVPPEAA